MKNSKTITKVNNNSNLQNYCLRELLGIDNGITELFHFLTFNDPSVGEDTWKSLYYALMLQSDIQIEIMSRIPENIQESGFKE